MHPCSPHMAPTTPWVAEKQNQCKPRRKQMETSKSGRTGTVSRWGILALLAIGVLISFVDRTSISSTLADASFVKHFALTSVDRGWINSAFFWSYGLFQVPMGWVAD